MCREFGATVVLVDNVHEAFDRVKKIEAEGITLDEPVRKSPTTGNTVTYITDPWGTRIEIIERAPLGALVQ